MQYASLDGILRTILTIVCIYYLLKFIGKLLFPIMVKTVVDKAQENFHQQQQSPGQEPCRLVLFCAGQNHILKLEQVAEQRRKGWFERMGLFSL